MVRLWGVGLSQGLVVLLAGCLVVGEWLVGGLGLSVSLLVVQESSLWLEGIMVVVRMAGWVVAQGLSLVGLALLWVVEAPFQAVVAVLLLYLLLKLWKL